LAPPDIFSVPDGNILFESTLSLMVTFYLRQFSYLNLFYLYVIINLQGRKIVVALNFQKRRSFIKKLVSFIIKRDKKGRKND